MKSPVYANPLKQKDKWLPVLGGKGTVSDC